MCRADVGCRKLWVFDFDDTLVTTGSRVFVTGTDGVRRPMSTHEYATHVRVPGESFDYSEFERLIRPRPVCRINLIMHGARLVCGPDRVVVLSARTTSAPIEEFLAMNKTPDISAIALASADPSDKARWLEARVRSGDVDYVEFFDDSPANVHAVEEMSTRLKNVSVKATLVMALPACDAEH